ncbi:MAG: membrane protein insertase YidC, partial [Burkholderiaceae bacterium]
MDMKRTVLWVVFSFSLLMLWDNWMRFNGKPSMLFPTTTTQQAKTAPAAAPAPTGDVPQATHTADAANAGKPLPPPGAIAGSAQAAKTHGELITITTDVMKAEIDTQGGELRRLELLQKGAANPNENVVLFDASPTRTYLAETGLIGGPFPNHKSMFTAQPGPRALDGGDQVQLVLQSEENGVVLTKTYTFHRGDYAIGVRHEVTNRSGAPVSPSLYLQLVRDGGKLPGDSRFYSTFIGPAVYTDAEKFQKFTFDKIDKGSAEHATHADNGWIAMVQHYFVSAFIPRTDVKREIFTKKLADNLYAIGEILPMGTIAPGASATMNATLYSGPQESARLEKAAPGLELVKDYGWLTIIAKPIFALMTQIHKLLGNWGWTIIALTCLIKAAFFPLSAAS